MKNIKKTYNLVYKTTNLLNGMFYIGIHKTNNLNDSYLGSGKILLKAIKKYGKENFKREILHKCKTYELAKTKEKNIVNKDFLKRKDIYNLKVGGQHGTSGLIAVKDKHNKTLMVSENDPRYLKGNLVGVNKNKVTVKDKNGKTSMVFLNDPNYLNGNLVSIHKGKVTVKDSKGKTSSVDKNDPRYLSGELVSVSKGKVVIKDENGKNRAVNKNHYKIKNGTYVILSKGRKWKK